jgi:hypothetical protein
MVGGSSGGSVGNVVHRMGGSQNVMVGRMGGGSIGGRVGGEGEVVGGMADEVRW